MPYQFGDGSTGTRPPTPPGCYKCPGCERLMGSIKRRKIKGVIHPSCPSCQRILSPLPNGFCKRCFARLSDKERTAQATHCSDCTAILAAKGGG